MTFSFARCTSFAGRAPALLTLGLTLSLGGATCDDTVADPATGNLDRLADAVLVTPDSDVTPRQSYLVLANPDIEQLRVFNAQTRVFERGPNVFFPLAVQTGPATLRLSSPVGRDGELFALDSAEDLVRMVRVTDGDDNFTLVGDGIKTASTPSDVAALGLDDGSTRLFVALEGAAAVQVIDLDPQTGIGAEVTRIELGAGARPSTLEVDPTGLSVVVTDSVRDVVSILVADPPSLDRTIDVGGPTAEVSIGRVNPGDGLAPIALVVRRNAAEVAAIRLFRPGYREPRAELMGRVELPGVARVAYVPDESVSSIAAPRVCCVGVVQTGEPTRAWGAVVTDLGELLYLRFDARFPNGREDERGFFRLMDGSAAAPAVVDETWSGLENATPVLTAEPTNNFGSPSYVPYLPPENISLALVYEGQVVSGRAGDYLDDGDIDLGAVGSGIEVGDALIVDVSTRQSCPDVFEFPVLSVSDDGVVGIGPLSDDEETCLNVGGRLSVDIRATGAFTVFSTFAGDLGRRNLDTDGVITPDEVVQTPGFEVTLVANAATPLRDDVLTYDVDSNRINIGVLLSQDATTTSNGFGRGARLATSIVGGMVSVPGPVDGTFFGARRMYLSTGAGLLIELNETETEINSIVSHR